MRTLQEIEAAIDTLPRKELWELKEHLDRRCEDEWDRQLSEEPPKSELDALWAEAEADIDAGRTKPLDEFLDHS